VSPDGEGKIIGMIMKVKSIYLLAQIFQIQRPSLRPHRIHSQVLALERKRLSVQELLAVDT
jgi:hypothetical protein